MKLDSNGDSLWLRRYGRTGGGENAGGLLCKAAGGGYALAGSWPFGLISCDAYLARIDEQGGLLWERAYGTYNADVVEAILPLSDGGFVLGGSAHGPIVIRVNADGDTIWQREYPSLYQGVISSLAADENGGFVATGHANIDGSWQVIVMRIDSSGNLLSTHSYGWAGDEMGQCIIRTTDGGWLVAGQMESFATHAWDVFLVKEAATGDTVWTRVYGNDYFDTGEQAICWPNNTCTVLSNYGNISGWWGTELSAIDGDGNILWRRFYLMSDDWIPWVAFAADRANRYIMAGRNGFGQLVIVKTQTDTLSGSSVENRGPSFTEKSIRISVAPNPFNSRTWIRVNVLHSGLLRLRVFNILGEQVLPLTERWIAAGEYTYPLDMANLSSATYFLRAEVKSSKVVVRISLEK